MYTILAPKKYSIKVNMCTNKNIKKCISIVQHIINSSIMTSMQANKQRTGYKANKNLYVLSPDQVICHVKYLSNTNRNRNEETFAHQYFSCVEDATYVMP